MTDLVFQQSYIDPAQSIISYGPKIIKINKDFTYVSDNYNYKAQLKFVRDIKFNNCKLPNNVACRDIESHAVFRADDFDDLVVVRRCINGKYFVDRIDYLNIEFRPIK
jgi:hypothetical protein